MFAEALRVVRKLSRSNQAHCAVCLAVLVDAEWFGQSKQNLASYPRGNWRLWV